MSLKEIPVAKTIPISVYEVVGTPFCGATGDGEKVSSRLASALRQNQRVSLSSRNVSILTSAFPNAAVGQLDGKFGEEKIRRSLDVEEITSDEAELLGLVVETGKKYFEDPERAERIAQRVLEGDV